MSTKTKIPTFWSDDEDRIILSGYAAGRGLLHIVRDLADAGFIRSRDSARNRLRRLKVGVQRPGNRPAAVVAFTAVDVENSPLRVRARIIKQDERFQAAMVAAGYRPTGVGRE